MRYGKKIWKMLAVAVLAAGVAAGAQDAPPPGGPGMGPGQAHGPVFRHGFGFHRPPMEEAFGAMGVGRFWRDPVMVSRLKITDEQQKSMDAILLQHRETLVDLHASLEKAELKLGPMLQADQPNESQIEGQIDAIAQARANLEKANARFLLAIRAKLTPEQWKGLQQIRAERMEQFRKGRGMRRRVIIHRQGPPPDGGPDGGQGGGPGGFME